MAEEEHKLTPEDLVKIAALESEAEAEGKEERQLEVEIYDEHISTVAASGRRIQIPKPSRGMLFLYYARQEYFEEAIIGLGRLLWMLDQQRAENYAVIRRIRSGEDIPEPEATAYLDDIAAEDEGDYYVIFWQAARYGEEEAKKKVEAYLSRRVEVSRSSSSSPAGQ